VPVKPQERQITSCMARTGQHARPSHKHCKACAKHAHAPRPRARTCLHGFIQANSNHTVCHVIRSMSCHKCSEISRGLLGPPNPYSRNRFGLTDRCFNVVQPSTRSTPHWHRPSPTTSKTNRQSKKKEPNGIIIETKGQECSNDGLTKMEVGKTKV
jgi:hypothetical protein